MEKPFNERLSPRGVFESQDIESYSEIRLEKFENALLIMGIKLRPSELNLLRNILDKRLSGFLRYVEFLRELEGVP